MKFSEQLKRQISNMLNSIQITPVLLFCPVIISFALNNPAHQR